MNDKVREVLNEFVEATANSYSNWVLWQIKQIRDKAVEALSSDPWQPIETAPKNGTKVDLWYPKGIGRVTNSHYETGGMFKDMWVKRHKPRRKNDPAVSCYPHTTPTHWMPLPKPPKE